MKSRAAAVLLVLAAAMPSRADDLAGRIAAIAKPYEATVGVSAIDTMTGRKTELRGGDAFPMGGLVQFPISLALLRRTGTNPTALDSEITIEPKDFSRRNSRLAEEAGRESVKLPLGTLVVLALRDGDDTAADALLDDLGGPTAVQGYLSFLGVRNMDVSRTAKQIAADVRRKGLPAYWRDPRDTSTPDAMVLLLRMFNEKNHGMSTGGQNFVNDILKHTTSETSGLRGLLTEATVEEKVAFGDGVVNDIAIVSTADERHRLVLAIFTKGWKKTSESRREKLILDIAREIYLEFTKQ